jgi:hypothetical protein
VPRLLRPIIVGQPIAGKLAGMRSFCLGSRAYLSVNDWGVFLAGCSPAEPAFASSIHSATRVSMFDLSAIHRPVPCVFVDCVRESRFPIHPTVCFKVGRFTITQSSWTTPNQRCSQMDVWPRCHHVGLVKDRGQFATLTIRRLGEPIPPRLGESPFPLVFYLSWMSTKSQLQRFSLGSIPVCPASVLRI